MDRWKNKPALLAASLAAGILLSRQFGYVVCGLFWIGAMAAAVFWRKGTRVVCLMMLFAALGGTVLSWQTPAFYTIPNREVTVTGYVSGVVLPGSVYELRRPTLYDGGAEGTPMKMTVRLTAKEPLSPGDRVEAVGKLSAYEGRRNSGGADYRTIMLAKNVSHRMNAKLVRVTGKEHNPFTWFGGMKESIGQAMDQAVGEEESGYLQGILFGDKGSMSDEALLDFRRSGLSHLLAVSGLHIGVLVAAFCAVIGRRRKRTQLVLVPILLAAFLFFTGFSPSVLRASVMAVLFLVAEGYGYRYNLLTSLFTAAMVILLLFPYQLFSAGFLLSFSCVLGIGLFAPAFRRWLSHLPGWLASGISLYLSCQLGMLPVSVALFNQVQLYGLLANLLAVPLISFALIFTLLGVVLMPFSLSAFFFQGGAWVMAVIRRVAGGVGGLPYAVINLATPSLWILAAYYGLLFVLTVYAVNRQRLLYGGLMTAFAAALCLPAGLFDKSPTITMLDVGDGLAIHVKTSGGRHVLIDSGRHTGTDTEVIRYLRSVGANQLICVNTHEDADHYAGFLDIVKAFQVELFVSPVTRGSKEYRRLLLDLDQSGTEVRQVLAGSQVISSGFTLTVLSPKTVEEGEAANAHSLNCVADISGVKLLITGDTPIEAECDYPKVDVLQVAHHGSDTSTSDRMLAQTRPKISLVSGDRYVDDSVLNRLGTYYDTKTYGAITLQIQDGEVKKR